jgi:hypothetical protein
VVLLFEYFTSFQRLYTALRNSVSQLFRLFLFASSFNDVQVEVAIHTILYVRQVYPAEIFVRRKKYETPVFQSRHPALNEYISGAVKAIADELAHVSIFL